MYYEVSDCKIFGDMGDECLTIGSKHWCFESFDEAVRFIENTLLQPTLEDHGCFEDEDEEEFYLYETTKLGDDRMMILIIKKVEEVFGIA